MLFFFVFFLLWTELRGKSEIHSLTYIYTAFSKPPRLPGFHNFTAIGLLDSRIIDFYDSDAQKKVPKQTWMAENLDQEYWDVETEYLRNEQEWFKKEIDKIMKRRINKIMKRRRESDTDAHILQKMRGCVGEVQPDGTLRFVRGMEMYRYDGNPYISFNSENQVWDAETQEAQETQREWNDNKFLKESTKNYLENECINLMTILKDNMKNHPLKVSPPEVFLFSQKSKSETTVILTCLATGFYPKDVILQMKKNGRVLTREDGVESSGVRPNEDDTFQRKDRVEILKSDVSTYTCEVIHRVFDMHVEKKWDHSLPEEGGNTTSIIAVAAIGILVINIVVAVILYKKWKSYKRPVPPASSEKQENDSDSKSPHEEGKTTPSEGNGESEEERKYLIKSWIPNRKDLNLKEGP